MLFKRKRIPFPIPDDARELTEEEMILVNGGSERRENSNEGVAGANVGDTIQRNDGTVVTLSQADIDYAKKQIGGSGDSFGASVASETVCSPGADVGQNPSGSAPVSNFSFNSSGTSVPRITSSSSAATTNTGNDCSTNTIKGPNHHSAYDQQFINEMMEKERKSALGGNGIQGAAVSEKTVEGPAVKPNTKSIVNIDSQYNSSAFKEKVAGYTAKAVRDDTGRRSRGYSITTENYPKACKNGPSQLGEQDPLPLVRANGFDVLTAEYTRSANKMEVTYYNIRNGYGVIGIHSFSFEMTNKVRNELNGLRQDPDIKTTGTQEDTGYGFHYSDYQTTWGCGRGSTQPDITKFAKWSDQALSTFYGGSYVNVHD